MSLLIFSLYLTLRTPHPTSALPLIFPPGPTTNHTSPSFVSNPRGRGTTGLLSSSIITLTLCVYTSIHLNIAAVSEIPIPFTSYGIKRSLVYKIYWVFVALFAPELVLYAAYNQWTNAKELVKQLKKLSVETPPAEEGEKSQSNVTEAPIEPDHPIEHIRAAGVDSTAPRESGSSAEEAKDWSSVSMMSAFFIVMGGLAYEKTDIGIKDPDHPHVFLTPAGFLRLAKGGYLHPSVLDERSIADRSKTDYLGKLLVCVQALWMVLNCIARKANGLPNTLIEVNVVVHVAITVVVYVIWWHKPLNVNQPIVLKNTVGEDAPGYQGEKSWHHITPEYLMMITRGKELGYVVLDQTPSETEWVFDPSQNLNGGRNPGIKMTEGMNDEVIRVAKEDATKNNREYAELVGYEIGPPENLPLTLNILTLPSTMHHSKLHKDNKPLENKQDYVKAIQDLKLNERIHPRGILLLRGQFLVWSKRFRLYACYPHLGAVFLSEQQLSLVTKIFANHGAHSYSDGLIKYKEEWVGDYAHMSLVPETTCTTPDATNYEVEGSITVPLQKVDYKEAYDSRRVLSLAALLSNIYAGCHAVAWNAHFPSFPERFLWRGSCICIAAGSLISIFLAQCKWYVDCREDHIPQFARPAAKFTVKYLTRAVMALYAFSRAFIVIEAFISVRSLPDGAYRTADWVELWPHV